MANIKITTVDTNIIKVEFRDYYPTYHPIKLAYYNRNEIEKVEVYSDRVVVHILNGRRDWELSYAAADGAFIVDDVDGDTTITDNEDLALKIASLIKS